MTRENEIKRAACENNPAGLYDNKKVCFECFVKGAEWADLHKASPWHSVADGDLPKEPKGDCEFPAFLVAFGNGYIFPAYYEEDAMGDLVFYDVTESIINVEYWMEIPQLPKESEVKK